MKSDNYKIGDWIEVKIRPHTSIYPSFIGKIILKYSNGSVDILGSKIDRGNGYTGSIISTYNLTQYSRISDLNINLFEIQKINYIFHIFEGEILKKYDKN